MKSIDNWKKDLLLEELSFEGCNLKDIMNSKMLSFADWKIKALLQQHFNEQSPNEPPGAPGILPGGSPDAPPISGAAAQSQQQPQQLQQGQQQWRQPQSNYNPSTAANANITVNKLG